MVMIPKTIKPVIYTFIENDLVGMVAPTPVCPRAKSRELQSSSLISRLDNSQSLFCSYYDFEECFIYHPNDEFHSPRQN